MAGVHSDFNIGIIGINNHYSTTAYRVLQLFPIWTCCFIYEGENRVANSNVNPGSFNFLKKVVSSDHN
jgi:hypothetical protein